MAKGSIVLVVALIAGPVSAHDDGAFGLVMGKPVQMPACRRANEIPEKEPCVTQRRASSSTKPAPDYTGEADMNFPFFTLPGWVIGSQLRGDFVSGRLVRLRAITKPYSDGASIRSDLVRKFGTPLEAATNWPIRAKWQPAFGTVTFYDRIGDTGQGTLTLTTPEGEALAEAQLLKRPKGHAL